MDGRRLLGVLAGFGIAATLAAGCSSSGSGNELTADGNAAPAAAPPQAGGDAKANSGAPQQQQPQQQQQVNQPGVDRKLIRTATLELSSANVTEVANKARDVASRLDGFSGQEEVKDEVATLTLHIPSNQFDKALADLTALVPDGLISRKQTAEDVTEQLVDVDSRISTQKQSVERVRALLARAQTVGEIVQIESEVTRREADLESLQKRRETLTGQVALSKVTLKVTKRGQPAAQAPASEDESGFIAGLKGGWNGFLATGGWLLNVVGVLLPFLIVLGVPGYFALRWWARRRRVITPRTSP
jgi:hypothetical protein